MTDNTKVLTPLLIFSIAVIGLLLLVFSDSFTINKSKNDISGYWSYDGVNIKHCIITNDYEVCSIFPKEEYNNKIINRVYL